MQNLQNEKDKGVSFPLEILEPQAKLFPSVMRPNHHARSVLRGKSNACIHPALYDLIVAPPKFPRG